MFISYFESTIIDVECKQMVQFKVINTACKMSEFKTNNMLKALILIIN